MTFRTPNFWYKNDKTWQALLLYPLSLLWFLGAWLRTKKKPIRLQNHSVVIGNVTAGGTGKTPLIRGLRRYNPHLTIAIKPYPNHIQASGYHPLADHKNPHDEILLHAHDGAVLLLKSRQDCQNFDEESLVFDDGYQDSSIKAKRYVLLVDGEVGFGNQLFIPAGPLREPIGYAYKKADVIVQINGEYLHDHIDYCQKTMGYKKILHVHSEIDSQFIEELAQRQQALIVFAGLGRNQKFFAMLKAQKLLSHLIIHTIDFADHYPYSLKDCQNLVHQAQAYQAMLVTTEKDFMRLQHYDVIKPYLKVAPYSVKLSHQDYDHILS